MKSLVGRFLEHSRIFRFEEILKIYWADNVKSHRMSKNGSYSRVIPHHGEERLDAQKFFLENAVSRAEAKVEPPAEMLSESLAEHRGYISLLP